LTKFINDTILLFKKLRII